MKEIVINSDKKNEDLVFNPIHMVRVLIVNSYGEITVCEKKGIFFFPGGEKKEDENSIDAVKRVLKEKYELDYNNKEIVPFVKLVDYQKGYLDECDKFTNRKVITDYFVINSNLKIKNKYNNDNAQIYGFAQNDFSKVLDISTKSSNRIFFDKELITIGLEYNKLGQIDLHIHSTVSDGEHTKEELKEMIKAKNINTIAICDHDKTNAFEDKGYEKDIDNNHIIIPGVEIGCYIKKGTFHMLGYDYDTKNEELKDFLELIHNNHIDNMKTIYSCLVNNYNVNISPLAIEKLIEQDNIGRVFLAKELVKNGYAKDVQEAFSKYLISAHDDVRPSLKKVSYKDAIKNIHKANGFAVLAHPVSLKKTKEELEMFIKELKEEGLDGIETYNQIYTKEDIDLFQNLAHKYDLYQTIGSDFHGYQIKPNVSLGNGSLDRTKIKKLSFVDKIIDRHI